MSSSPSPRGPNKSKTVCVFCRQRKVGCDRQLPKCGFCLRNRVECRYAADRRRPGLRAGYVSQLEHRLDELEERVRHLEDSERGVSPDSQRTAAPPSPGALPDVDPSAGEGWDDESAGVQQQPSPSVTSAGHDAGYAAMDPLSPAVAIELCNIWFETYHPWFPILHQPSLLENLRASTSLDQCSHCLTVKAIVAVTLTDSRSTLATAAERQQCSRELRDKILVEAVEQSSLQSIQALLILSNLECGSGKISKFWNLISLCKRMAFHIGLRDFVANQGNDFNGLSAIPPRLLPLPCTIIDREERIRTYWMTEILDSISTLGTRWNSGISVPDITAVLPCSDSIWAFPEHIINVWSIGEFYFSSAFSLCIILSTSELWHVHRFLQQSFDLRIQEQKNRFQAESQQIDERLTTWRAEFVAAVYRLINTEHAQEERAEMDPNIVLTNCILDCAVIVLFQRVAPSPPGIESACASWTYATNRCVYACDDLSAKVRLVHDNELEVSNPNLIFTIFVAARFYLIYAKAVNAELPRNLHVLIHALNVCGRRWELARRYETIIQTAAAEHQMPIIMSSLPTSFFDPQVQTLDINDTLLVAAETITQVFGMEVGAGSSGP